MRFEPLIRAWFHSHVALFEFNQRPIRLGLTQTSAWLANPLLLWSWVSTITRRNRMVFVLAVMSLVLMLGFLDVKTLIEDESGTPRSIAHIGIGYWIWVLSGLFTAVSSAYALWKSSTSANPDIASEDASNTH